MYFGRAEFTKGLNLLMVLACLGAYTLFGMLGIIAGSLVASPFAAYYHDAKIVIWPATAGMALGMLLVSWAIFFRGTRHSWR